VHVVGIENPNCCAYVSVYDLEKRGQTDTKPRTSAAELAVKFLQIGLKGADRIQMMAEQKERTFGMRP
jgi:hypothetical protein